jgi:hypothetical protein
VNDETTSDEDAVHRLRLLSAWFLATSVLFFPLIFNPVVFGYFDAGNQAQRLTYTEEHLVGLRVLFAAVGVAELSLGVALWAWGRRVADASSGGAGVAAGVVARVSLAAGVLAVAGRGTVLLRDAGEIAGSGDALAGTLFWLAATGFTLSLLVHGALMVTGAMPAWLGLVWMACAALFWVGALPLWFFVAALAFGLWGVLAFRPGHAGAGEVSATPP